MLDFVLFAATAILGLLVLLFFALKDSSQNPSNQNKKIIPRWNNPPTDKAIGDLGELAKHGSLHQYLMHLHGNGEVPVTSFWWGNTRVVSVCSPQAFKELVGLVDRPVLLFKGFEPLIGAASIQYANGEDWEMRQKCLYRTLKGQDLQSYFPKFVDIAKEAGLLWTKYSPLDKVPLGAVVFPMTIKGIAQTCLGDVFEDNAEVDKLSSCYHSCWREMEVRITSGDPEEGSERARKFEASRAEMMETIHKLIQSCKEGGSANKDTPLFVDSMLRNYPSEDTVTSDVMSFLVGGFHTSGYLMTWMLWYLVKHPQTQQRLLEEIKQEVGGDCGDKLKAYAYSTNTFMRQVQDETLRLSTLAPWGARYSDSDVTVCGYKVPAGVPIITALGVALKNSTQWEDEDKWDPDRFSSAGKHGRRGNEFCPFGIHSKRKCPGYLFSYFEVATFIAILIQRYEFVAVEGQEEVEPVHGLVTEPKEEIFVHLRQRS